MSDSSALLLGNGGQDLVGGVEVLAHDGRLVLEHGEEEREAHDVELLVAEVEAIVARYVAEQVHLPVEMRYGAYLAADVVVEAIERVGVDEAVADPDARLDRLVDLVEDGEGLLDAVLGHQVGIVARLRQTLRTVAEYVEAVLARDAHELAVLGPQDDLGRDLDAPDEVARLPVVEGEAVDGAHAEQVAAVDVLRAEAGLERLALLEVLEYLDLGAVAYRVLGRVVRPDELLRRAVGLVAQRHRRVDDVLAVAAHDHEAAVGVVRDRLRVDVARAHVLHRQHQLLAVLDRLRVTCQRLRKQQVFFVILQKF